MLLFGVIVLHCQKIQQLVFWLFIFLSLSAVTSSLCILSFSFNFQCNTIVYGCVITWQQCIICFYIWCYFVYKQPKRVIFWAWLESCRYCVCNHDDRRKEKKGAIETKCNIWFICILYGGWHSPLYFWQQTKLVHSACNTCVSTWASYTIKIFVCTYFVIGAYSRNQWNSFD